MDRFDEWGDEDSAPLSADELGAAIDNAQPVPSLPCISVVGGELPGIVDEAEDALRQFGADVYQRGGLLVRPGRCPVAVCRGDALGLRLVQVSVANLVEILTTAARWVKFDGRSNDWVPTDCPRKVAEAYMARVGKWRIRVLTGVIEAPTLRPDGTLLDRPGYDPATGLLLHLGCKVPPIKAKPSKRDALKALGLLTDLLAEFPFLDRGVPDHMPDRSVALSAILTTMIRPTLPTAPLHGFSAPVAGSGKSLLVDIASMIATGRPAAVIAQSQKEDEFEKRLGGAMIGGDVLISIDNCEAALGGELLCQALTQQVLKIRELGTSKLIEVPSVAMLLATGNNLILRGDMTRRALVARLDPARERPELHPFARQPLAMIAADRGKYIAAALTVLRAYHAAGRPTKMAPLASFAEWSETVRAALVWLGEADPCETMDDVRQADPELDALSAVLTTWRAAIGLERVTVAEVIKRAIQTQADPFGKTDYVHPEFREALLVAAGDGGAINSRKLGKWLSRHKDRIVDGMRIMQGTKIDGNVTWLLNGAGR